MELNRVLEGRNRDFKLLVLDIDGTIITNDRRLTRRTIEAIQRVKAAGIKVTVATGRQHPSAVHIARAIGINAPLISSDGSMIQDLSTGETEIYPLDKEKAKRAVKMAEKYKGFRVEVFFEKTRYHAGEGYKRRLLKKYLTPPLRHSILGTLYYIRDFVCVPVEDKGDIDRTIAAIQEDPLKLAVYGYGPPEELVRYRQELSDEFGSEISMTTALTHCVDVLEKGVSKAQGIAVVAEKLGISSEQVITVGDNLNDIEMIQYAGLGVAMGNASQQVKERADYVTATNEEEGLAQFLEKLLA